jgi:hypothetical protein
MLTADGRTLLGFAWSKADALKLTETFGAAVNYLSFTTAATPTPFQVKDLQTASLKPLDVKTLALDNGVPMGSLKDMMREVCTYDKRGVHVWWERCALMMREVWERCGLKMREVCTYAVL